MTISFDESIDESLSIINTYIVNNHKLLLIDSDISDKLWGTPKVPEFMTRIKVPLFIRRKPYQIMSISDFCKHINMRRKNIPQNREGGKAYQLYK